MDGVADEAAEFVGGVYREGGVDPAFDVDAQAVGSGMSEPAGLSVACRLAGFRAQAIPIARLIGAWRRPTDLPGT
jgi:hypothetical protein